MHPFIHITDTFVIPTYILILSVTYSLGLIWADLRAARRGFSRAMALDVSLCIMVGGFIGARLFHVLYEYPEHYFANPSDIFKFWNGGFVFYGGLLGALATAAIFLRYKKESFLFWADFFAPVLSFGYALGRLGCFFNGCCYGKVCDLPWAIEFAHPGLVTGLRHPTQLYATFSELLILGFLLWYEKRPHARVAGRVFFIWIVLHALGRLLMEMFRDDYRGPEVLWSISSWLSLALLLTGTGYLMATKRK